MSRSADRSRPNQHSPSIVPDDFEILPTDQGYDRWSIIYDDEDNPLIRLEEPVVSELIGPVRDLDLLDLGCGTGRWSLRLAGKDANVTAVDFSDGMLDKARAKPGADRVRFLVHDLNQPLPIEDAAFDRVICCLVFDHIESPDRLFAEMRRLCQSDGQVIVSVMHPAMMLRGIQARFVDPETGRDTRPRSAPNQICDYVMAASRAGLILDHMSEHPVDEALAAASPRAAKYVGWPMLLAMRMHP